jgi:hypothetical protein
VLPQAKKQFWTIVVSRFSNQTIISKLWITERVYRWLGAKKDNISLNTQLLAMSMYFTYKGPIVSLDQVVTKKCNFFDFDISTNRFPSELHTLLLTKIDESLIIITCFQIQSVMFQFDF